MYFVVLAVHGRKLNATSVPPVIHVHPIFTHATRSITRYMLWHVAGWVAGWVSAHAGIVSKRLNLYLKKFSTIW